MSVLKKSFEFNFLEEKKEANLLAFIKDRNVKDFLVLKKRTANQLIFRYLMDSRLGEVYIYFSFNKDVITIEIKEVIGVFFAPVFIFMAGFLCFFLQKNNLGFGLIVTNFTYLYIIYHNFKDAYKNVPILIEKYLKGVSEK